MFWAGACLRTTRSWSPPSGTPLCMSPSMSRFWTFSPSTTRSSPSPCPCTSGALSQQTIIFSIPPSYLFSVQWQESRIVTDNNIEPGFWYPVSLEFLDYLWTPNIFIYNLKSFNSAKVLNRLAGKSFKYFSK